jgi:zinc protease
MEERMDGTSEHILENGLKVIIVEAHATPNACCSVWYRAGSKNESAGTTGLAHLLEHMMFKGTERFPKGEFDKILHRNGAIMNASTWLDRTNYYEMVSADRLELMLELEADRMRGALFNHSDLEDEMPVVRNELERRDDDPYSNLFEKIQSMAFLEHPYHWPTIGWKSDVEAIQAEQIREFYDHYYQPHNAFLVVVGDLETEDALNLVRKHFGVIPGGDLPPRPVTVEPPQKGERRVVIQKPGENDILGMAFRVPQRRHRDNYALDLLGQILGEGRTSRLYKALVDSKLVVRASAANYSTLEDPFLFFLDADIAPNVEPRVVEEAVDEVIQSLQREPVEHGELERARKRTRVDFVYRKDRVSSQAFFLGELEISCGWKFGGSYLDEIEKVTAEDLQRVAQTYLVPGSRTVGLYDAVREGEKAVPKPPAESPATAEAAKGEVVGVEARTAPGTATRPAGASKVRTHKEVLGNGIRTLVRPNRANQTVEIVGRCEGGMLLEGESQGLAHATARMLDRGTEQHTRSEISEILEGLGASISLRSSIEVLGFHVKCLREDLQTVVPLLSEILRAPTFPGGEWEIVRQQILNSIRESRQDTFDRAFHKAMGLLCGEENVYARMGQGSEETLDSISPEDMRQLHKGSVAGRRFTVAVVGDVSPDEGVDLVKTHLGSIPAGEDYPTREEAGRRLSGIEPHGRHYEHVELPEKSQVDLILVRPGMSRVDRRYDPASVANYILGGHFSSRLNKQLRDNEGLTYGTYSRLRPGLGTVPWYASIGVHPENFEKAREGLLREMKRLREGGVGDEEFQDAIQHLTGSFSVRLETNGAVANMLVDGERYGMGSDVIETYVDRILAISKDQVEEQAQSLFDPENVAMASAGTLG